MSASPTITEDWLDALGLPARGWLSGALPVIGQLALLGERAQAAAEGRSDVGLDEVARCWRRASSACGRARRARRRA